MKLITTVIVILFSCICSLAQINSTSFAPKLDYRYGTGTSNPQGIITSDLDNDGRKDVVVGNINNSSISV